MEEQFGLPEGLSVMDVITRCKQGQKMEILKQAKYLWAIFLTTACQVQGAHIKNKRLNYFFQARALRALGCLLADETPTVGGGKTF